MIVYFLIGTIVCIITCIMGMYCTIKGKKFTKEGIICSLVNILVFSFILWPVQAIWIAYLFLPQFESENRRELIYNIYNEIIENDIIEKES